MQKPGEPPRYDAAALVSFATALLVRAGLPDERARCCAEIFVEGDLLGHSTHGLALLPMNLERLDQGLMRASGDIAVLSDRGPAVAWDADFLPGPWVVVEAIQAAIPRAREYGICAITIRRAQHTAAAAAYLSRATDQGLMMLMSAACPAEATVSPHGGATPVYSPNPIAAGIPADGDPMLIDISSSISAAGPVKRANRVGERLAHRWLKDAEGNATDDPAALFASPPGSIMNVGGLDHGHKGFGLSLLTEALTCALGGFGRSDQPDRRDNQIFLQLIDPDAFGGQAHFRRETSWLRERCLASAPSPGGGGVRMPGQGALERKREQLKAGVRLHPTIVSDLEPWSQRLSVSWPAALDN